LLILIGCLNPERSNRWSKWHVWEGREIAYTGFWWKNVKERDSLEDQV
jgi:hypothetical protein